MSALLKLLPLAAVGVVIYSNSGSIAKSLNIVDKVQVAASAGIEMKGIAEAVALEYSSEGTLPVEDFGKFLRENMREKSGKETRDHTKDMWGTEYKLAIKPPGFEVRSAGPDKAWGTKDDLAYPYSLAGLSDSGTPAAASKSTATVPARTVSTNATPSAFAAPASTLSPQALAESRQRLLAYQLKRAADGSAQAQYDLGIRYLNGDGVEVDESKARNYLEQAAKNGFQQAELQLKTFGTAKP